MNPDQLPPSEKEFEKRLQDVRLRPLDPSWKEELLANFPKESAAEAEEGSAWWWLALPRAVAFPLIAVWLAIGFFTFETSSDRERPPMAAAREIEDPSTHFYEQRIASLCQERQRQFAVGQR
ncbi:MAG: hypothetical protein AAF514_06890 [Verrucomicrobiota bacterium]